MKPRESKKNSQSVLDNAPISLFRRLYQVATAASAEVLAADGLIPLEYGVLLRIHANPGVDQITLAGLLALDRTTTSSVLFKLERRGLVEREINEADRRARVLRLSPKGLEIRDRLRPHTLAAQENIWSVLTSTERKQLIGMLQRVMDANRHYMRLGAGRRKRTKTRMARRDAAVS
ncbi:MAG TPA: MarR family winged helix-turn-helix transcriptional regulator [Opitutus sp.]|nr:MarR family winged helix-turn-helix transcriptional regulator [Opitutus sp.]